MRQPVGGVTVYLHAAPSEQYNLLLRRLSILWLYCSYKKNNNNFFSVQQKHVSLQPIHLIFRSFTDDDPLCERRDYCGEMNAFRCQISSERWEI